MFHANYLLIFIRYIHLKLPDFFVYINLKHQNEELVYTVNSC